MIATPLVAREKKREGFAAAESTDHWPDQPKKRGGTFKPKEVAKNMTMRPEKKRVLLIGEQPDIELFAMLGGEGYEVATLESPHRAKEICPLYKPHVIILFLRYPNEVAIMEECLAMAETVPVVAAISLIAKQTLVNAVKQKAAACIVLPVKPQTVRETLREVALFKDDMKFPSDGNKNLATDFSGEKQAYPEKMFHDPS